MSVIGGRSTGPNTLHKGVETSTNCHLLVRAVEHEENNHPPGDLASARITMKIGLICRLVTCTFDSWSATAAVCRYGPVHGVMTLKKHG